MSAPESDAPVDPHASERLWQRLASSKPAGNKQQLVFEGDFRGSVAPSQAEYTDLAEQVRLGGLEGHYRHNQRWSWFLMALTAGMIGFQSVLLGMVGAGAWDFSAYKWLLPVLLAQNLGQVIGLAVIVVKSLFSEPQQS